MRNATVVTKLGTIGHTGAQSVTYFAQLTDTRTQYRLYRRDASLGELPSSHSLR
jgi:hypothetical protein